LSKQVVVVVSIVGQTMVTTTVVVEGLGFKHAAAVSQWVSQMLQAGSCNTAVIAVGL
jgi:ABC-type proline/glycine betaine transport system permease subunit